MAQEGKQQEGVSSWQVDFNLRWSAHPNGQRWEAISMARITAIQAQVRASERGCGPDPLAVRACMCERKCFTALPNGVAGLENCQFRPWLS